MSIEIYLAFATKLRKVHDPGPLLGTRHGARIPSNMQEPISGSVESRDADRNHHRLRSRRDFDRSVGGTGLEPVTPACRFAATVRARSPRFAETASLSQATASEQSSERERTPSVAIVATPHAPNPSPRLIAFGNVDSVPGQPARDRRGSGVIPTHWPSR